MAHVQVQFTHKLPTHQDPHTRILGIGGTGGGGWYRTTDLVISDLRSRSNSYYVQQGVHEVLVVEASHSGRAYIKTQNDGYSPDNLLALPEPPTTYLP